MYDIVLANYTFFKLYYSSVCSIFLKYFILIWVTVVFLKAYTVTIRFLQFKSK